VGAAVPELVGLDVGVTLALAVVDAVPKSDTGELDTIVLAARGTLDVDDGVADGNGELLAEVPCESVVVGVTVGDEDNVAVDERLVLCVIGTLAPTVSEGAGVFDADEAMAVDAALANDASLESKGVTLADGVPLADEPRDKMEGGVSEGDDARLRADVSFRDEVANDALEPSATELFGVGVMLSDSTADTIKDVTVDDSATTNVSDGVVDEDIVDVGVFDADGDPVPLPETVAEGVALDVDDADALPESEPVFEALAPTVKEEVGVLE
jgi:hypothetical protein